MKNILLFSLLVSISLSNKMITIPYSISFSQKVVKVTIAFTNNYNYPEISLQSPLSYLLINKQYYTKKGTEIFLIDNKPFEFDLYQEEILIQGYKTKLAFYGGVNTEEKCRLCYSHLSFGLGQISQSTSFIYQLYNRKEIDKMIFGIYPFGAESGEIYIGDIPNHLIKDKPHGECSVYDNTWSCFISMIKFVNKYKGSTPYILRKSLIARFSTEHTTIKCSEEIFEYFKNYIFKEAMENNLCWVMEQNKLYCPSSTEKEKNKLFLLLPTHLEFVFDNMTLSIPFIHLFDNSRGIFLIESDKKAKVNEIILGYFFLQHYFTIYDYNKKSVSFYFPEEDKFFIINSNKVEKDKDIRVFLLLILACILSLFSFVLIYKK